MVMDGPVAKNVRRALVLGGAAAAGAAVGSLVSRTRRLTADIDPLGSERMTLPEGTEHVVRTDDGAELAVTVCGPTQGPVVVLAHGWLCARWMWAPVAQRLVDSGHQVVAFDQRGHGESTAGEIAPTVDRLGTDLAVVLGALKIRDAVLVGHSMGGFASMAYACDHPEDFRDRIRALVLVSTAAHGLGFGRLDPFLGRLAGSDLVTRAVSRPRLGAVIVRGVVGKEPKSADLVAISELVAATDPAVRAACYLGFGQMDHRERLAKVDVPTVVMVGSHDALTPPRLGKAIARVIPGARFEVIDDAGHMLPFEAPDRIAKVTAELSGT
jgi:pimeloyl-ACP methyl ester carboxylesterase